MPEDLKAKLEAAAKNNNRTLTAELVSRLERSFKLVPISDEWSERVQQLYYRQLELDRRIAALERKPEEDDGQ